MIIDGGYLAWTYGPEISMHQAWQMGGRQKFGRGSNSLICLDARENWRTSVFPDYKSDRKEKTASNPDRQRKKRNVIRFIENHLKPDPSLNTLLFENCEADDLVAMAIMIKPGSIVFGVDKDLMQVPRPFWLTTRKGRIIDIRSYGNKAPVTVGALIREPYHVLLDLSLRGDASDSIPRLIPPRQLSIEANILHSAQPFYQSYKHFGEDFLTNLQIAVLPGPHCLETMPDKKEILMLVSSGEYWNQPLKKEYDERLREALGHIPLGIRGI